MIFRRRTFLFLSLFLCVSARAAEHLSNPVADWPDWKALAKFQQTITHDEFERLLRQVYCSHGISEELVRVDPKAACILTDRDAQSWFTLRFAKSEQARRPVVRRWRPASRLPRGKKGAVLAGLKIALDPGHIGGAWAKMEER